MAKLKSIPGDCKIKNMDIKEFRKEGFLQEVNRLFFHPLGMALSVLIEPNGDESLDGIWDYRDDPEGITFADGMIDAKKVDSVFMLKHSKMKKRIGLGNCNVVGIQIK